MQGVIRAKVLDLKVYTDQIAQVLGFEWKVAPTETLLECGSPSMLVQVPHGCAEPAAGPLRLLGGDRGPP